MWNVNYLLHLPPQTSVKYKTITSALWIGFATVSLSFLKINVKEKKLKTKTEAARGGCHIEVILTKDRQRESEMSGGGALNGASSSIVVLPISKL